MSFEALAAGQRGHALAELLLDQRFERVTVVALALPDGEDRVDLLGACLAGGLSVSV